MFLPPKAEVLKPLGKLFLQAANVFFFVFIIYILSTFKHETVVPKLESLQSEVQAMRASLDQSQGEREVFLKILILRPDIDLVLAHRVATVVTEQARLFGRDPDFILAVIKHESNFDPTVVSPMGAVGLMQVMPHWLQVLGAEEDLKDVEVSIKRGLQVYGFYEKTYNGSMVLALTAYNRGSWKVEEDIRLARDPNVNGYAMEIMKVYDRLKELR